ncbi:hypothetical protein GCM10010512_01640 [Streptomyces thermoviolaceus subsp. thermoviolaceus]|nr:hypothetical protein GCM10010512_01640 [Streptomyces thermoviolaceus subsp. thermoviolaceus]
MAPCVDGVSVTVIRVPPWGRAVPERLGGARLNDPAGESNALDSGRAGSPRFQGVRRDEPVLRPR